MPVPPADLVSDEALLLRRTAASLPRDPLALVTAMRKAHPKADPELISAIAAQIALADRARPRQGSWADDMIWEATALEQATRRDVARYRARSLAGRLGRTGSIVDLGCGVGVDARALAEAGFVVTVVDSDAWRCDAAAVNAAQESVDISARCKDVRDIDLSSFTAAFVDPARRTAGAPRPTHGGRAAPVADPEQWSPPWSWVLAAAGELPLAAKVSAGISPRLVPDDAEIEWIDHDGDTVEACVWCAPLAEAVGAGPLRRATVVEGDVAESLVGPDVDAPLSDSPGPWLVEPAPAVRRAHLVGALAAQCGLGRLSTQSTWLTGDTPPQTRLARSWALIGQLPSRPKDLRAALAGRGSITWKTADAGIDAAEQSRRVGHHAAKSGRSAFVVLIADGRAFEVEP